MELGSSSDSEEKKDSKVTRAMKKKSKSKRSMEEKAKGKRSMEEKALPADDPVLELITKKAGGIVINGPKGDTGVDTTEGKAVTESEGSKGKKMENVVKSSYSLRSHDKGKMDIDVKPTKGKAGKKHKKKELKRYAVEAPERLKRGRDKDDEKDDQDGTGAYATRSSTKSRKVRSL